MPTYDEVLFLGIEYGALALTPLVITLLMTLLFGRLRRNWVLLDLQFKSRRDIRKLVKPPIGGMLNTKYGLWKIVTEPVMGSYRFRTHMMYRCVEGFPYTLDYERVILPVGKNADGTQKVQEWVRPLPGAPSNRRLKNYLDDVAHGQVFGKNSTIQMLLIVLVVLAVIGLLINVAK